MNVMPERTKTEIQTAIGLLADEYKRMLLSLDLYQPRLEVYNIILEAYTERGEWDWRKCDGCSCVSEMHFPPGFRFPPCVAHDYLCYLGETGQALLCNPDLGPVTRRYSDKIFRWAMGDYGVNPARKWARWLGVRLAWVVYFKPKRALFHLLAGLS